MLCFTTPGELDLRAIQTFGLSSKDSSHIGRFGTGLKYATAIVLRLGGTIEIETPSGHYRLGTQPDEFRGKTVSMVTLNGNPLGFTTDLGRDWEAWMAYREFYSNTLDEGGTVDLMLDGFTRQADTTQIRINCNPLTAIHFERESYFIDAEETPLHATSKLEIYPGQSKNIFYKGIAVCKLPSPAKFRYNLLSGVNLTEDRTAALHALEYDVARELVGLEDGSILETAFNVEGSDWFEAEFTFSEWWPVSNSFLGTIDKLGNKSSGQALLFAERRKIKSGDETALYTEGLDSTPLQSAIALFRLLDLDTTDLRFVYSKNAAIQGRCEVQSNDLIIINANSCTETEDCFTAALEGFMRVKGQAPVGRLLYKIARQKMR